jgi:peroxiredoxin
MLAGVRNDRIAFLGDFFYGFYNLDKNKPDGQDLVAFSKWLAWEASPLATQHCITAFGTTDFRADLAQIDIPTLVVHGDADQIVPIDVSGRRSHEIVKGSRFEVLPGAPHGFAATHVRQLNALMLDFLRD